MKDRERAQRFLKVADNTTGGEWVVDDDGHIYSGDTLVASAELNARDAQFIAVSRTEAPYLAQRLLDALDVMTDVFELLEKHEPDWYLRKHHNAMRQFLEGSESHG